MARTGRPDQVSGSVIWHIWPPNHWKPLVAVEAGPRFDTVAFRPDHVENTLTQAQKQAGTCVTSVMVALD